MTLSKGSRIVVENTKELSLTKLLSTKTLHIYIFEGISSQYVIGIILIVIFLKQKASFISLKIERLFKKFFDFLINSK